MRRGLRIGLRLDAVGTLAVDRPGNVQGDEQLARGWKKYLERRDDVESVQLVPRSGPVAAPVDVLIHFTVFGERQEGVKNLLYLQNAFPPESYQGGTVGMFRKVQAGFDGYLFTSETLMRACAPGVVVPFATDPELFFPQPDDRLRHPVAFVGNDIRGPDVNHRYLLPALPFGLVIYGNATWLQPFAAACRGKISAEELPRLYSSARVNLNAHVSEHLLHETVNLRIYDVLACRGFVLSDRNAAVERELGDAVVCTDGDEELWAKLVRFLADVDERDRRADIGHRLVTGNHTYAQRVQTLMGYLKQVV